MGGRQKHGAVRPTGHVACPTRQAPNRLWMVMVGLLSFTQVISNMPEVYTTIVWPTNYQWFTTGELTFPIALMVPGCVLSSLELGAYGTFRVLIPALPSAGCSRSGFNTSCTVSSCTPQQGTPTFSHCTSRCRCAHTPNTSPKPHPATFMRSGRVRFVYF